ncbi:MAG: hypothetical protein ACYDG4_16785 [Desulfuromonadaceae bacterium]
MAKAKITDLGNVKVSMTRDQYIAVMAILQHVRLGRTYPAAAEISDLVIDLQEFNSYADLEEEVEYLAKQVSFSYNDEEGFVFEARG